MNSDYLTRRGFIVKLGALAGTLAAGGFTASGVWAEARTNSLIGASLEGGNGSMTFSLLLEEPVKYKVFTLEAPDRIVIDLLNTELKGKLKQGAHDRPPIQAIRYATREDGRLRVVLETSQSVKVTTAQKAKGSQNILSVTLSSLGKSTKTPENNAKPRSTSTNKTPQKASASERDKPVTRSPARDKFIVVIDPGHGGKDPGAIGPNGTQEKDVVLEVARKLKTRIEREQGMRAILTRDADVFIPLRTRMDIAHQHKADLFISIHADANPSAKIGGSSVYILSQTGASSEAARLLAESENSYELRFGDRSLTDTNSRIASVLLDLSQNAMMDRSLNLANGVLHELAKIDSPLRRQVESAQFVVLRSPDIPSMLVETAFISNPLEEKRLRTAQYQQKLASAMFKGVKRYQIAYAENGRQTT